MDIEDKIVWGGLYAIKHSRWSDSKIGNDQIYGQAVPCKRKNGSIWMQDTHQIRSPSMKKGQSQTEAAIEQIFDLQNPKVGDGTVSRSISDWYHKGCEELTEYNIDDYELICDLHDYRPFKVGEDYRDYDPCDVLYHIHLYQEHGYSWDRGDIGVMLIRKDAIPSKFNKFKAAMSDVVKNCRRPHSYDWGQYDTMLNLHKDLVNSGFAIHPRVQIKYENTIYLVKRLDEMQHELDAYFESHKYCPKFKYESSTVSMQSIHPDVSRYLKESCYCPGEIYGVDGFYYQVFDENSECKILFKSDKFICVISRQSLDSDPQFIIFWLDDSNKNRIIDAQRLDITKNNSDLLVEFLINSSTSIKADQYTQDEFPEEIDEIIQSVADRITP